MAKKTAKSSAKSATAQTRAKPSRQSPRPDHGIQEKPTAKLSNVWRMAVSAWQLIWDHKRLIIGITLVYGLLNLLLVRGLAGGLDLTGLKQDLNEIFTGQFATLASSASIFVLMVGSAGNTSSDTAGAYQIFLWLIASLAVIWALRQVVAGKAAGIRDAFYRGMYPLIPFVLVLLVVALQLVPMLIGSSLYATVLSNGIAVHAVEKLLWLAAFIGLILLSLYLVTSSILALYIVTLPDMTPLKALRSARELVRGRRWLVMRKMLALPLIMLLAAAVVMLPIIIWLTPLAQWVFFLLSMFALTATHAYLYTLYRELLNE